mgnify:CR=1 FL=1
MILVVLPVLSVLVSFVLLCYSWQKRNSYRDNISLYVSAPQAQIFWILMLKWMILERFWDVSLQDRFFHRVFMGNCSQIGNFGHLFNNFFMTCFGLRAKINCSGKHFDHLFDTLFKFLWLPLGSFLLTFRCLLAPFWFLLVPVRFLLLHFVVFVQPLCLLGCSIPSVYVHNTIRRNS